MSKKVKDLQGRRFGRWSVLSYAYTDKKTGSHWNCLCDCGARKIVRSNSLVRGNSKSCGCYKSEIDLHKVGTFFQRHGHARKEHTTKTYTAWQNMIKRCYDKRNSRYPDYGGRGIVVCDRWRKFEHFLQDMGEPPSLHHSLERKNNSGNYEPDNCKWATKSEQANNTRKNIFLEYRGERKTIAQWSQKMKLNYSTLRSRVFNSGWSVEQALTAPTRTR